MAPRRNRPRRHTPPTLSSALDLRRDETRSGHPCCASILYFFPMKGRNRVGPDGGERNGRKLWRLGRVEKLSQRGYLARASPPRDLCFFLRFHRIRTEQKHASKQRAMARWLPILGNNFIVAEKEKEKKITADDGLHGSSIWTMSVRKKRKTYVRCSFFIAQWLEDYYISRYNFACNWKSLFQPSFTTFKINNYDCQD